MEEVRKTYEIGGKKFYQKKLVLGQIKALLTLLEGFVFPEELNIVTIFKLLGTKASRLIAIILNEEGALLKDKDMASFERFVDDNIEYDVALEIMRDFFLCNKTSHIAEIIKQTVETMSMNTVAQQ